MNCKDRGDKTSELEYSYIICKDQVSPFSLNRPDPRRTHNENASITYHRLLANHDLLALICTDNTKTSY